ncbi:helix-turn-helix domain-containing protein [Streptomyces sp. 3211]|uniref:helix-turn-helix domain-containing protein n=1 Tax=Streptomyces sp. 3211 TaxID=1964449 RepID=UPI003FA73F13
MGRPISRRRLDALVDRSRRPHVSPHQVAAEMEALVCELRRSYPRWGVRRIAHELAQASSSRCSATALSTTHSPPDQLGQTHKGHPLQQATCTEPFPTSV